MTHKDESSQWEDPIVEEVRMIRDAHAKKFNYDVDAIFNDLVNKQALNEKLGFKYVSLPPKRREKRTGTD